MVEFLLFGEYVFGIELYCFVFGLVYGLFGCFYLGLVVG